MPKPPYLRGRITPAYRKAMYRVLLEHYFKGWAPEYFSSDTFRADMELHLTGRLLKFENSVLPWVSEVFDINGAHILEIGCGTGSSTIPFALRAGRLDTCDVLENSIEAARQRARLMGVNNIHFHLLDEAWVKSAEAAAEAFSITSSPDVILMIALLEHLTISERINVLRGAFRALKPGGIILIYETPNRLNYFDWHTFLLPFIDWLPDELMKQYASRTPRTHIDDPAHISVERLYRMGRGVSFHEFDLALPVGEWHVVNDGFSHHLRGDRRPIPVQYYLGLWEIVKTHLPGMPLGFLCPSLDLIIRKGAAQSISEQRDEALLFQEWLGVVPQELPPQVDTTELLNSRLIRLAIRIQSSRIYTALRNIYWRLSGFR